MCNSKTNPHQPSSWRINVVDFQLSNGTIEGGSKMGLCEYISYWMLISDMNESQELLLNNFTDKVLVNIYMFMFEPLMVKGIRS